MKPKRKVTKKRPGKDFRAAANKSASKALAKVRNWTELETEVYVTIFPNAEVFRAIQSEFRVSISAPEFVEQNKMYESSTAELDTSLQKLRNKYNNMKRVPLCPFNPTQSNVINRNLINRFRGRSYLDVGRGRIKFRNFF